MVEEEIVEEEMVEEEVEEEEQDNCLEVPLTTELWNSTEHIGTVEDRLIHLSFIVKQRT